MINFTTPNIHTATEAKRTLPPGKYFGFAIGADSVHQELLVELQGRTYYVGLGSPVVLVSGGLEGQPVITPVRKLVHQVNITYETGDDLNSWRSPAHLLAYQCARELAHTPATRLRTIVEEFTPSSDGAGDVDVYIVPFAGRESALFSVSGDGGNVDVLGVTFSPTSLTGLSDSTAMQTGANEYELLSQVHTSGILDVISQDVGAYDALLLRHGDGGAFSSTVNVRVR